MCVLGKREGGVIRLQNIKYIFKFFIVSERSTEIAYIALIIYRNRKLRWHIRTLECVWMQRYVYFVTM